MTNLQTLYGDNDDNQVQTRKQKKTAIRNKTIKKKEGKKNKTTLEFPTFSSLASQKSSKVSQTTNPLSLCE